MATGFVSAPVLSKHYVFDPRPRFPFLIAVKRYWIEDPPATPETDPQRDHGHNHDHATHAFRENVKTRTLVFIHHNGGHKEQWEPTIERLFAHQRAASSRGSLRVRFHDMWALDMPNQGDSAVLNEEVLRWGYYVFSWETHARAIHAFLAGLGTGVDVDFSKRRLTLVGHSMGAMMAVLASAYYPLVNITSLHLIEPSLLGQEAMQWGQRLAKQAAKRQDVWPSAEETLQTLRTKPASRNWDERILKIFVTHGLRPLPTADYPEIKKGVTLKCTREQQAANLREYASFSVAYRYLAHALKQIPTHIVYGEILDSLPHEVQQEILHVASGGISNFASVTMVPGVGHMIVQTHPDLVADLIWKQLCQRRSGSHTYGEILAKL